MRTKVLFNFVQQLKHIGNFAAENQRVRCPGEAVDVA